jgi:Protein of unknown function (DUF1579)
MVKRLVLSGVMGLVCAASVAAQPPPATPGPEQKNLARFAGTWKMEGTMQTSPLGPGGPMTGTETCKMFEGGWHIVCDSSGTGPMGAMKGHALMTYDRNAKQYRYFAINNMPDAEMATGTLSGDTWTWTSKMDMGGKTIQSRFTLTHVSPTVQTYKWEMSEDGTNWKPIFEGKSTKVGS